MKARILRKKLRKLASEGEIERVLQAFRTIYEEKEPTLHKEVIILHGRYNRLRSDGKVSLVDEKKEMNIISTALGKYTKAIDKNFLSQMEPEQLSQIQNMIDS